MLGFYTHHKFTTDPSISDEDFKRIEFPEYIRENIFNYEAENKSWKLSVSRDGLIQFQRKSLEEQIQEVRESWTEDLRTSKSFEFVWVKYLRDLNVIYFLLDCSTKLNFNIYAFQYYELTYLDAIRVHYDEDEKFCGQVHYRGNDLNALFRQGQVRPSNKKNFERSAELPTRVLEDLTGYYLDNVLNNDEYMTLLHRTAKSYSEHNLKNYENSIVISWFILETYINQLWDKMLDSNDIKGGRKRKLKDRDYTASVKTEFLQLQGSISDERYESLDKLRSVRNKIAHNYMEFDATDTDSKNALELVKEILKEKIELSFPFATTGFPIIGL